MIKTDIYESRPIAPQENIIQGKKYRFTLMTDRLIRMEFSEEGYFEDRPSQMVMNRDFAPVEFRLVRNEEGFELYTDRMQITYDGKLFSKNGLSAIGQGGIYPHGVAWHYGESEYKENLKGTTRTLDGVDGECNLEEGLMSWKGYAALDDSHSLVLTPDGWIEPRVGDAKDVYLFMYGDDYEECLYDFYRLTGKTPMLPRYALGNWWSRYYKYSEESYRELVTRFENEQIPFSVAVIDMDWHLVDIDPKYGAGWTGYTWNNELFPDPQGFLSWLHEHGMKTTLNLHPADGIRAYEKAYPVIAEKMGVDIKEQEPVNFDIADRQFLEAYFEDVLHPMEDEGVDFWWIDWQQGNNTRIPGLDPLWMLNHYHYADNARNGKRPLTFSRYAGPGSHRYPVGFSGDTIVTWESLDFQPYFTSTASNIGYGWWSHDIGGHMWGYKDNVLALRWLQFGVFSPINRLHSTNNEFNGKEPWRYPMHIHHIMNEFLRLRHKLLPYLYTMNYRAWSENIPLIIPVYYKDSLNWELYKKKNEYYFGSQILAAPITTPQIAALEKGKVNVWLPDGIWIDFFTGLVYRGGRSMNMYRGMESFPLFAKAGAIIPMTDEIEGQQALCNPHTMTLRVYGGADGAFTLYEDDNDSIAYMRGQCVKTEMSFGWEEGLLTIAPACGDLSLIPKERTYTVEFHAVEDTKVIVTVDGVEYSAMKTYDTMKGILRVSLPKTSPVSRIVIRLEKSKLHGNPVRDLVYELLNQAQMGFNDKTSAYSAVCRPYSTAAVIGELCSLDLDADIQGALVEILTADA